MRRPRPTYANVTASLALFVALGGTSYAITKLPKNSVGSTQVRDGSLQRRDLAATAVPRGPRGADGPTGPAGPAGATGPVGPPGPAAAEAWKALVFINGWTNYGGDVWEFGGYRKDQIGIVHLRGLVTRASGLPTGTIATLPPGYRPRRGRIFAVHTGETPQQVGRVNVHNDGSIVWESGATGEPDYTSLDTIAFDTD